MERNFRSVLVLSVGIFAALAIAGGLVLESATGKLIRRPPMIYEDYEGVRTMLAGEFQVLDKHHDGFRLAVFLPTAIGSDRFETG